MCRTLGDDWAAEEGARRAVRIGESIPSDPLTARAVGQHGLALAARDGEADVVEARATLERAARLLEAPAELPESYARAAAETLREVRAAQQRLGARGAPPGLSSAARRLREPAAPATAASGLKQPRRMCTERTAAGKRG